MLEHLVITHNVKIAVIVLYFCILTAIGILSIVEKFFKKDVQKYRTAWVSFLSIVALFTIALSSNVIVTFLFITLISYLAFKEFISLVPTRRTDRRVMLWAYCSIPIQFYFIYTHWVIMFYLFIPLYAYLLVAIRMVCISNTDGFIKSFGTLHMGMMVTIYAIGYLGMILIIPFDVSPAGGSVGLLFFILVVNIMNDFFQMACGKLFGKHKILPKVSPNKTWEGFIGGIICTTVLSVILAPYLTPMSLKQALFAGSVLSAAGFFGDVFMSAVKRDMGVKDTGTLIPGHGGILDRLDSLIFTAPLFFHFIAYTNHIVFTKGF